MFTTKVCFRVLFCILLSLTTLNFAYCEKSVTYEEIGMSIGGFLGGVEIKGDIAYLAIGDVLHILNKSGNDFTLEKKVELPKDAAGLHIEGNYLYVLYQIDGFCIYDISDPANPVQKGAAVVSNADQIPLEHIFVADGLAYITIDTKGWQLFDVSDPNSPSKIYSVSDQKIRRFYAEGQYAYGIDEDENLKIFDMSVPANPDVLSSIAAGDIEYSKGFAKKGNYLYIPSQNGVEVVNVSNPSSPQKINYGNLGVYGNDLVIIGNKIILNAGAYYRSSSVEIIDISNPESPSIMGNYEYPAGHILFIASDGSNVFTGNGSLTFQAYDETPDVLMQFDVSGSAPVKTKAFQSPLLITSMLAVGDYAYISSHENIFQYDFSDIENPELIRVLDTRGQFLSNSGNLLFSLEDENYAKIFHVTDISIPANPVALGQYNLPQGSDWRYGVRGDYLYVFHKTNTESSLDVYDISNPADIKEHGSIEIANVKTAKMLFVPESGSNIFLGYQNTSDAGEFLILDISSPGSPSISGTYSTPAVPNWAEIQEDVIFILSNTLTYPKSFYLEAVDISSPGSPAQLSQVTESTEATVVRFFNESLIVTSIDGGLFFYSFDEEEGGILQKEKDMVMGGKALLRFHLETVEEAADLKRIRSQYLMLLLVRSFMDVSGALTFATLKIEEEILAPVLDLKEEENGWNYKCRSSIFSIEKDSQEIKKLKVQVNNIDDWIIDELKCRIEHESLLEDLVLSIYLKDEVNPLYVFSCKNDLEAGNDITFVIQKHLDKNKTYYFVFEVVYKTSDRECPSDEQNEIEFQLKKEDFTIYTLHDIFDGKEKFNTDKVTYLDTIFIGCVFNTSQEKIYGDIESALEEAEAEDVIEVCPGCYKEEPLVIEDNGLFLKSLYGRSWTLIELPGEYEDILSVEANNVTVTGFTFNGNEVDDGISIFNKSGLMINENRFLDCLRGIIAFGTSGSIIQNNEFANNLEGIVLAGKSDNTFIQENEIANTTNYFQPERGMSIIGSNNITILNNTVSMNPEPVTGNSPKDGICIFGGSKNNSIVLNTVKNASSGISLIRCSENQVLKNDVNNCYNGIYIINTQYMIIENCTLSENITGLSAYDDFKTRFYQNIVKENRDGVFFSNSFWTCIRSNIFESNKSVAIDHRQAPPEYFKSENDSVKYDMMTFPPNIINNIFKNNGKDGDVFIMPNCKDDKPLSSQYHAGLLLSGINADIGYNKFDSDSSAGIICMEGANPVINHNVFTGNDEFGVQNLDDTIMVNALYNYWGDSSGPGGEGSGSGDAVSSYVDFGQHLTEAPGLKVLPEQDTIYVPAGETNRASFFFSNWQKEDDEVTVTFSEELSWVAALSDTDIYLDSLKGRFSATFTVPDDITDETYNTLTVSAVSKTNAQWQDEGDLVILAYIPEIQRHYIAPDSVTLTPDSTFLFTAFTYDQYINYLDAEQDWSATGGTIDEYGTYTAGGQAGTFEVVSTEKSTGKSSTATVVIVDEIISVEEEAVDHLAWVSCSAFPNPFYSNISFIIDINKPVNVRINIYDCFGRLIKELMDTSVEPGKYSLIWSPENLTQGAYFFTLEYADKKKSGQIIYME